MGKNISKVTYDYWKNADNVNRYYKRRSLELKPNKNVLSGVKCRHKDCNVDLTITELLLSDYCFKHSLEQNQNNRNENKH